MRRLCEKLFSWSYGCDPILEEDADTITTRTRERGGNIVVDPFDLPTVGRVAVLVDPQGAAIAVIKPAVADTLWDHNAAWPYQ